MGHESSKAAGNAAGKPSSRRPSLNHGLLSNSQYEAYGSAVPNDWGAPVNDARAAMDFDYCFLFKLPRYAEMAQQQSAANSQSDKAKAKRIEKYLQDIKKESDEEKADFRLKLNFRERMRQEALLKGKAKVHAGHVPPRKRALSHGRTTSMDTDDLQTIERKAVRNLVKDMIVRPEDSKSFRVADFEHLCETHDPLVDARNVCIDTLLQFFRRDSQEEQYHSFIFRSIDNDELFVCVKMLEKTALAHAQISEYQVQLDGTAVREKLSIKLESGPEGKKGIAMMPGYVSYDEYLKDLCATHRCEHNPKERSVLRKIDQLRLLYDRVSDVLNIDAMRKWGLLVDYFPLHSQVALEPLAFDWATMAKWYSFEQPIEDIRRYYGEEIALYFVFLGTLCRYLRVLVAFGLFIISLALIHVVRGGYELSVMQLLGGNAGTEFATDCLQITLAVFTIIWMQVFVLNLKQDIAEHLNSWGMDTRVSEASTVKDLQNERFADNAWMQPSELNANVMQLGVSLEVIERGRRYSAIVGFAFLAFTLCVVAAIFWLKAYLLSKNMIFYSNLASYGLTIQIKIFNAIWAYLAVHLVDNEHYEKELAFLNALSTKMYLFEFINDFCSFYYIAFFMEMVETQCPPAYGSCWSYLTYQMMLVYALYLIFTLWDILYPLLTFRCALDSEVKHLRDLDLIEEGSENHDQRDQFYSFIEQQSKMPKYDAQAAIDDYIGVISPLSFVLLFGITLPLSSLLLIVTVALQIRADAWKLTRATRRPYPSCAFLGLGVWQPILEYLSVIAMLTNVALVCRTVRPFSTWPFKNQLLLFFSASCVLGILHHFLRMIWPEVTNEVLLARRRHEYQRECAMQYKEAAAGEAEAETLNLRGRCGVNFSIVPRLERGQPYFEAPVLGTSLCGSSAKHSTQWKTCDSCVTPSDADCSPSRTSLVGIGEEELPQ